MNKEGSHNFRLGTFVVLGAVLLIFGLYTIGNNKNMFRKSFRLTSVFYDVSGLTVGNNVRYSGIDVGTVDKIEITSDTTVRIVMLIDNKLRQFIRKNSVASIGTDGLMGNKLINISPGDPSSPLAHDNEFIPSLRTLSTEEMLRTLDVTNKNISIISNNLREITENVNKSRGTLYTVLMDTSLAKKVTLTLGNIQEVSNNLNVTSRQLSGVINDVSHGKGALGAAISDTVLANDLRTAIKKVKEGSERFSTITTDVSTMINTVNSGKGVATTLLKDSAMADDLKKSISNIESATFKLNEDLEALKHNFLLRGYFKKK